MTDKTFDPAIIEEGRKLFAGPCDFVLGAAGLDQLPDDGLPEIAFAGRSNVGKSSLINALTGRKALARTSNTPGRTQQVNFFNLGDRLMLADLPGYGYAKAPKGNIDQWTDLVNTYLKGRAPLRRTLVMIDSRHGFKKTDYPVMDMLDKAAQVYQIVLTKADKVKDGPLQKLYQSIQAELVKRPAAHPDIFITSSEKKIGIAELRAEILSLAL